MKLLTVWCRNKRQVGGVLHSNKKTLVHNIALVVPTIYQYGSLKLWAHLSLDDRYWKYLINGISNKLTPPPGPPTSSNTKIEQPHYSISPPFPSQGKTTLPPPSQSTRPAPVPSLWEAPTPPRS